jgi:hypothetical protein
MSWRNLNRSLHRIRWRASSPVWRRRLARQAALWVVIALAAGGVYFGSKSPATQAAVRDALQCRINLYDCRDFSTQHEAQSIFWKCGGRKNDVHRLDEDRDGWACEMLP